MEPAAKSSSIYFRSEAVCHRHHRSMKAIWMHVVYEPLDHGSTIRLLDPWNLLKCPNLFLRKEIRKFAFSYLSATKVGALGRRHHPKSNENLRPQHKYLSKVRHRHLSSLQWSVWFHRPTVLVVLLWKKYAMPALVVAQSALISCRIVLAYRQSLAHPVWLSPYRNSIFPRDSMVLSLPIYERGRE